MFVRLFIIFFSLWLCACTTSRYVSKDEYELGRDAYDRKHYEQAREFYKKFANENQEHPMAQTALYYWADSARACGRFKEAAEVYERLIKKYQSGFWVDLAQSNLDKIKYMQQ